MFFFWLLIFYFAAIRVIDYVCGPSPEGQIIMSISISVLCLIGYLDYTITKYEKLYLKSISKQKDIPKP